MYMKALFQVEEHIGGLSFSGLLGFRRKEQDCVGNKKRKVKEKKTFSSIASENLLL